MPSYLFECGDCKCSWEKEGHMDKPPKRSKCPLCEKMRDRVFVPTHVHYKGLDFHTNQVRAERYAKHGMDKDTANEFYSNSVKWSKERMKSGGQNYKKMSMPEDKARKSGMISNTSGDKKQSKIEQHKALSEMQRKATKKDPNS